MSAPAPHLSPDAPSWCREPYRLLFPLGIALSWVGIGHWLVFATLKIGGYNSVAHAITQIQGFMTCFAVGFLLTAIPRRTGTAGPAPWQMGVACAAPVVTTLSAFVGWIALSQVAWLAVVATLLAFMIRRFRSPDARRKPPNSFVWLPLSFIAALVGAGLTGIDRQSGWLHDLGIALVLQGLFIGLVLGVGGMVLPLITRGDAPPDAVATPRDRWIRSLHVGGFALLVLSFVIEHTRSAQVGYALRAALTAVVLIFGARIYRLPSVPGWHRWLVWLSAWCLPLGYTLAAALPGSRQAGLHVVFIGGFAFLALGVGIHVSLAHGGRPDLVKGRPWQVPILALCFLCALAGRMLMVFDPTRVFLWMGVAAGAFLLGTLPWLWLAVWATRSAARVEEAG